VEGGAVLREENPEADKAGYLTALLCSPFGIISPLRLSAVYVPPKRVLIRLVSVNDLPQGGFFRPSSGTLSCDAQHVDIGADSAHEFVSGNL
jgi:hypothetical protein